MLNLFRNRSEFVRNSLKLVSGAAIAQAISLLLAPVITRLYSPSDFGTFTFLIALAGGIALIGTFRYEMAIMLPKDDKSAANVMFLSLGIAMAVTLLATIATL